MSDMTWFECELIFNANRLFIAFQPNSDSFVTIVGRQCRQCCQSSVCQSVVSESEPSIQFFLHFSTYLSYYISFLSVILS